MYSPLCGLEIAEVAASVYDSRDFYATFNCTEENDVVAYTETPATGYAESGSGFSHHWMRGEGIALLADRLHPAAGGQRFVLCDVCRDIGNVVVGRW